MEISRKIGLTTFPDVRELIYIPYFACLFAQSDQWPSGDLLGGVQRLRVRSVRAHPSPNTHPHSQDTSTSTSLLKPQDRSGANHSPWFKAVAAPKIPQFEHDLWTKCPVVSWKWLIDANNYRMGLFARANAIKHFLNCRDYLKRGYQNIAKG